MENDLPVSLHFIKLFRMAKQVAKKHDLPMPNYDKLRRTYTQQYAEPLFLRNDNGTIWVDRYYLAIELYATNEFRYLYIAKHHINEEIASYRMAAKERGTDNLMPKDIKRFFTKTLRIMKTNVTNIWVDEDEFGSMKAEAYSDKAV